MQIRTALAGLLILAALPSLAAKTVTVHVFNFDFGEAPPTHSDPIIEVGDTIKWVIDAGLHSTTSAAGFSENWDSGFLGTGGQFSHTFTNTGTFPYYCAIHGSDLGGGQVVGMSGKVIVVNTYLPTSFTVFRGVVIGGGLAEVQASDDQYLRVQQGVTLNRSEAPVQVLFRTTSSVLNPALLGVSLEDGTNSTGLSRRVEMLNYETGQMETINLGSAQMADKVSFFQATATLSRFVNQSTGEVTVKVSYFAAGPLSNTPFNGRFDRVAVLAN
ncbi:MAG: hypothetical protein JSS66_01400 [Armatimonadetes bacterium]|nr:hypothetical protein [Armatimonadota bacterium]